MDIKEQVLSLSQLSELYKLGFDVIGNSSMCWIMHSDNDKIGLTIYNKELYDKKEIECIPTLSIGDIIEVLPIEIGEYVLDMNRKYVSYDSKTTNLFYAYRRRFIDSLFDCLVWCIKQKHIAL